MKIVRSLLLTTFFLVILSRSVSAWQARYYLDILYTSKSGVSVKKEELTVYEAPYLDNRRIDIWSEIPDPNPSTCKLIKYNRELFFIAIYCEGSHYYKNPQFLLSAGVFILLLLLLGLQFKKRLR